MTLEGAWERKDKAHEYRRRGEFNDAGDYYTITAYEYLGESPPTTGHSICHAEYFFLQAAVCYRLGNNFERGVNRCRQGILIAEDVLDRVMAAEEPENIYEKARRGAIYEYIGDFRAVGELEGADEAYDNAIRVYQDAGDPNTGYSEQEHMWLMEFFDLIADTVGDGLDPSWRSSLSDTTFTDWVKYKRNRLPKVLEELLERGKWDWEDASS